MEAANNNGIESEETLQNIVNNLKTGLQNLREQILKKEKNPESVVSIYYNDTNLIINHLLIVYANS